MDYIPLLNPVQIAKFLIWQKYSECPAGLFLSQYLDLAFGDISLRKFSMNSQRKMDRVPLFHESVDLVTRFVLSKGPVSMVELARRTVARTIYDAKKSVDRLNHLGFVKLSILNGQCIVSLTSAGLESVDAFQEAWGVLRRINPRIFPLKSYEDRIIAETECRGKPRLVNKALTLASSACSLNMGALESARLKIQMSETGLAIKTRSAHSQVQILPSAPKKQPHMP